MHNVTKTRKLETLNKNWAVPYTCPDCCDKSYWCRYRQLNWGWWVLLFSCMHIYSSKRSEAKPLKYKKATTVSQILHELTCRYGCFSIQINDQGWEFVNSVSAELHRLTGTIQRVMSSNHTQASGLVERQNGMIRNWLIKALDSYPSNSPSFTEGTVLAHCVTTRAYTKYSPFELG